MQKCPRCAIPLFRTRIDGVNVRQCGKCQGNLIELDRLNRLAATRKKSTDELMRNWAQYDPIDTSGSCRCPACRTRMEKETKRGGVKFDHYYCRDCGLVWLDPGEIELYQLAFLVSEKGQEAERFKAIHANMTEDERTRLEQMISGISDASSNGLTNPYDG